MLVLILAGCALAGCSGVGSVHPIYTPDDTVALSGMVGTWSPEDKEDKLVISPGENGGFKLRFWDEHGVLNNFDVHLTKIGGVLFGDLLSRDGVKDAPLSMPVHLFARVELDQHTLKLQSAKAEWFDAHLSKRPWAAHHIKQYAKGEQGWIYLTDSTKKVRSFLKKCAKCPEAFSEALILTKASDSQELPPAPPPADSEKKEGREPGK
jgi:hypothetical protein